MRASLLALLAVAACARGADVDTHADSAAASPPVARTDDSTGTPGSWRVTEQGIGPLRAGMTLAEASAAVGGALVARAGADSLACDYLEWRGGPPGVRVMIEQGRVARVEVHEGDIATAAGARIGDSEERVRTLYAGRVATTPHKYTDGHYLTVTPEAASDSVHRLVFETDGSRVTEYRAGRRPPVEYVEGCS